MTLLPYALAAAQRGWHIFPCAPGAKTPHLVKPGKPWQIRWSEAATNDLNKLVQWWTKSPWANVGVAAKPSGLLVLDADVAKQPYVLRDTAWAYLHERLGPDIDGTDVLRALCERYEQPWEDINHTYRVCTTRMGCHYYFRWPDGVQASQASVVKGVLDVRCNGGDKGGYVLAAGSSTSAGAYWAENALPIAPAPPWLVELVREKPRPAQPRDTGMFAQPGGGGDHGYLADRLRLEGEGNRNNLLQWSARVMCEDGAAIEDAYEVLVPAALDCGLDGGERQARSTIQSAYRLQQRKQ